MKVGIFMDLRNPPGWRRPWAEHYARSLDLIVAAEDMGADAVWFSEHHFFEDGYLPQPLTFAAAAAARTTRMRIGTAIVLGALRPPVLTAEEAAVVDIISGGRLELGFGAGYRVPEYAAYGADIGRRYSATCDALAEVRRLFAEEAVSPLPVQRPLPLWLGFQGPQGAYRAGRLGVGLLSIKRHLLAEYHRGLVDGGHDVSVARMGGVVQLLVANDPDAAAERVLPFYAYQQDTYARYGAEGAGKPPPPLDHDELRREYRRNGRIGRLSVLTADAAAALLRRRAEGLPVEHLYVWASVAGMPDDLVEEHVSLLVTRVRPQVVGEDVA